MFRMSASVHGSVDIEAEISAALSFKVDLSGVRSDLERVVKDANTAEKLAGLDVHQRGLTPLAPSTMRRRRGSPTPFVEHGTSSRIIANLLVDVSVGPGILHTRVFWPGMPWLDAHNAGSGRLPSRQVAGISLATVRAMDTVVIAESDRQFAEKVRTAGRSGSGTFRF